MSTCPNCGQSLQPGQTLCPHCGMALPPVAGRAPDGNAAGQRIAGCFIGAASLMVIGPLLTFVAPYVRLPGGSGLWLVGAGSLAMLVVLAVFTRRRSPHFVRWLFIGWTTMVALLLGMVAICSQVLKS